MKMSTPPLAIVVVPVVAAGEWACQLNWVVMEFDGEHDGHEDVDAAKSLLIHVYTEAAVVLLVAAELVAVAGERPLLYYWLIAAVVEVDPGLGFGYGVDADVGDVDVESEVDAAVDVDADGARRMKRCCLSWRSMTKARRCYC